MGNKHVADVFEWRKLCLKYAIASSQTPEDSCLISNLLPTINYTHTKEHGLRLSAHAVNLLAKGCNQSVVLCCKHRVRLDVLRQRELVADSAETCDVCTHVVRCEAASSSVGRMWGDGWEETSGGTLLLWDGQRTTTLVHSDPCYLEEQLCHLIQDGIGDTRRAFH